jgi:hypothetical protein
LYFCFVLSFRSKIRFAVDSLPATWRAPVRATLHALKHFFLLVISLTVNFRRAAKFLFRLMRAAVSVLRGALRVLHESALDPGSVPGRLRIWSIKALNSAADFILYSVALPLGRLRSEARLAQGAPASLWGVTPILTLPLKARADRRLGFWSQSLVFVTYYIARDFDHNLQRIQKWMLIHAVGLVAPFGKLLLAL